MGKSTDQAVAPNATHEKTLKILSFKRQASLLKYEAEYRQYLESGQSIKQWSHEHGMNQSTFYKHLRMLREYCIDVSESQEVPGNDVSVPAIVPVSVPNIESVSNARDNYGIEISSGSINVKIGDDVSAAHIRTIILALKSC